MELPRKRNLEFVDEFKRESVKYERLEPASFSTAVSTVPGTLEKWF